MAAFGGKEADDVTFSLEFADYLDQNQYEFHEIDSSEVPGDGIFQEMINTPAPVSANEEIVMPVADSVTNVSAPKPKKTRHVILTECDVDNVQKESVKERTRKQTVWGVNVFRDWLQETGHDTQFEQMSKEVLASTLREFYPSARQVDGKHYQKQSLINIRSSINRHLQQPPFNSTWNLMHDAEFTSANRCFSGHLRMQKAKGLDTRKKMPPIQQNHIMQMYTNYFEPHFDNDPRCLQHKVYFDMTLYLGKRAKENLRKYTQTTLLLKTNNEGREYVELSYNEATKKSQGDDYNEQTGSGYMLAQPENQCKCPVYSYKLYLSKLNPEVPELFQTVNPHFYKPGAKWYKKSPVGENKIGEFMKEISHASGLAHVYKNHSVRGTTIKAMRKADAPIQDIAWLVKQKNLQSIQSYLDEPSHEDKERFAEGIYNYVEPASENDPPVNVPSKAPKKMKRKSKPTAAATVSRKESDSDSSHLSDFEEPQPPHKKAKKTSTKQKAELNVVPYGGENSPTSSQSYSNVMQTYKQNPIGMFVGATLYNCTININMPK